MARKAPQPAPRAIDAASLALILLLSLAASPRSLAQTPPAPPGNATAACAFTMDDYALGVTDDTPLSPTCAMVKLTSTLLMFPSDFFKQHALCPAASIKFTLNGAIAPVILDFATAEDKSGANAGTTNYIVSGAASGGIQSYALAANVLLSISGNLTISNYFSFAVNTSDTSTPKVFLSQQQPNSILAWNYDADAFGRIRFVNVALFAPAGGVDPQAAHKYVQAAKMKGFCVETYGPLDYANITKGGKAQFLGVEDFATGRLMLYAQLQRTNSCIVQEVVHLNRDPMQSKCGIPTPPSMADLRKMFLKCAAQQALPLILDALKDMLKSNANQTVPTFTNATVGNQTVVTTTGTDTNKTAVTQKMRMRGSALISAIASGISELSGSFDYDGGQNWALNFSAVLGDIPGPTSLTAFQLLKRTLEQCAPFIRVNLNEGAVTNPVLKASFSYSSAKQLVDLRLNVSGLWIFGAAVGDVGQVVDFNPANSTTNDTTGPTIATRLVVDRVNGLRVLSLALTDMTVAQLAKKIGFEWPLADDVVAISSPNILVVAPPGFVMEDGVELPTSLRVNVLLSIPGISMKNAVAGILIRGKTAVTLSVYGDCQPIPSFPAFVAKALTFSVSNTTGLTATFLSTLYDVGLNATFNYNKGNITTTLVATNVQVLKIIQGLFADVTIPSLILTLITPIKFTKVSITIEYRPNNAKKLQFTFAATPDINGTELATALKALGLSPSDLSLDFKTGKSGSPELSFGLLKSINVSLPKPFTGPGSCTFSVQTRPSGMVVYGAFQAAVVIQGSDLPLNFSVGAGLAVGAAGTSLQLDAALLSPFSVKNYPWITLNSLSLSASIQLSPVTLRSFTITGSQDIMGVSSTQLFAVDSTVVPPVSALFVTVSNFSLQTALNQMGINASLGSFNLVIRQAAISYSATDVMVNGISVPMGVSTKGSVLLFNLLDTTISLVLSPTGTSFSIAVNGSVLNQVLVKYVLKPITGYLNSTAEACRSGANALASAQKNASAALDKAKSDLQKAQDDVTTKLKSLLDYSSKVNAELDSARVKAQDALKVFNDAKSKADTKLADARTWLDQKTREFNDAVSKANTAFSDAQAKVNQAQKDYDNWYSGVTATLNKWNNEVNSLNERIRCAKDVSCNCLWSVCWPCCKADALILPALLTSLGVAKAALWAAQQVIDTLASASAYVALTAAKAVLSTAQTAVNTVAKGVEYTAKTSAETALKTAQTAATAVLSGAEYTARTAADTALTTAQTVVNGVLNSTYYVSSSAANATFAAAQAAVTAAQFTANAALDAVQGAINGLVSGIQSIADPKFFQINSFSLGFDISKSPKKFVVNGSLSVKLGNTTVTPSLSIDISNPLDIISNAIKDLAVKAIKASSPAAAKALP